VDGLIESTAAELRRAGRRPYVVPRGGASPLGALGYWQCAGELEAQFQALGIRPDRLVVATGSCGTQAGLLAGLKLGGLPYGLTGVTVSRPVEECLERILHISMESARLAGQPLEVAQSEVVVLGGYIGPGYGMPTRECIEAIRLVARTEGIFLDPTYTAKAMAGLIGELRAGRISPYETVVFLHTGGEPAIFAHADALRRVT
jgi:1-aminocyclopropane-1-carboxylate deaminase/D-cysteine desulfhydrase-like pyridoxal-dependent ACC family enzyme